MPAPRFSSKLRWSSGSVRRVSRLALVDARARINMLSLATQPVLALNLNFGGAPKKVATPAFAYGLPGNFNALGGAELNFDPAGFLEVRHQPLPARTVRDLHMPCTVAFA